MDKFISLLIEADERRRTESDSVRAAWWDGVARGLTRALRTAEHDDLAAAVNSDDKVRAARGRGYRAGLTLEPGEPE